jgi:hypothetical protein
MKKMLMAFLALSALQVSAVQNCPRGSFEIGVGIGVQNMQSSYTNPESNAFYDAKDTMDLNNYVNSDTTFLQDFGTPLAEKSVDVVGSALNYKSISNFNGVNGFVGSLSMGYNALFACGQYSMGIQATAGYEGSSVKSILGSFDVAASINSSDSFTVDENGNPIFNQTITRINSGESTSGGNFVTLKGGMTWGLNALLGKEFSWGNVSALVGVKFKQFKLSYFSALDSENPSSETYNIGVPGFTLAENANYPLNTLAKESKSLYSTALSLGFVTKYYINESMSLGMSVVYDMYAPLSFKLADFPISSPSPFGSDGEQVTDYGTMKFNNNCFTVMFNLNYAFGGSN